MNSSIIAACDVQLVHDGNATLLNVLTGTLYLIATPIGNLEDITLRALRILREEATLIACEDTRQTTKLLEHYDIRKPLVSFHEHNEPQRTAEVIQRLERGESVALVSDAGTPLVSDPGYKLVHAAIEKGLQVIPVPGASAALAALTASGLPTNEFRFIGFLPAKAGARRKKLEQIVAESATVVAYESPHRILETLGDMAELVPAHPIVLAREITKIHEEFLRGTASEIRELLSQRDAIKGEITLLIGKAEQKRDFDPQSEVLRLQSEGMEKMEAIKTVAKQFGLPKREIYRVLTGADSNRTDKRRD